MPSEDEKFMQRCLDLAKMGAGYTSPNPMVGSVVVYEERIIGEGFHRRCGEAHAEVNAVNSVRDKSLLRKSTLYVNLEPCAHQGRTPACSTMIIENRIPKVVVGSTDPFEKVAGKGIQMLRNAGCEVVIGILDKECRELNRRFFTYHILKRPYIILKWAQSSDGFIDFNRPPDAPIRPNWITDEFSRTLVHKWRAEEDAIMVGTNTAAKDNPKLDVRNWFGKNPIRVVLDRKLRLSENLSLFDSKIQTLVFTEQQKKSKFNSEFIQIDFSKNLYEQVFKHLYDRQILSVIIEGGAQLINGLLKINLWDEARIFVGDKVFFEGIEAPKMMKNIAIISSTQNSRFYTTFNPVHQKTLCT
jgi:diaminohydroxyphosphoribosylaminopyrimidine deaminase/5-amino-6-(5-phosphoribosylamino)uracil reductase